MTWAAPPPISAGPPVKSSANTACASTRDCLAPTPCPNLDADHTDYLLLLRKLREIPGIKKIFIRSGIRFDYLLQDKMVNFFADLVKHQHQRSAEGGP